MKNFLLFAALSIFTVTANAVCSVSDRVSTCDYHDGTSYSITRLRHELIIHPDNGRFLLQQIQSANHSVNPSFVKNQITHKTSSGHVVAGEDRFSVFCTPFGCR